MNETSPVLNIFIIRLTSLWGFIVFLSMSVFLESAHIWKDLQKSCRSAQIRKDQKPGLFDTVFAETLTPYFEKKLTTHLPCHSKRGINL